MFDYLFTPVFWTTLLAGVVGGATISTPMVVWLSKTWLGERIKKSVEDTYNKKQQERKAEFDKALEVHKHELTQELEGWKAGYQKLLDEGRIRFSKLHQDRATAIKRLFVRLVVLEEAVGAVMSPVRLRHVDEPKLRTTAAEAFNKFAVFFTHNRIFFTEADCQLIENLRETAKSAYIHFTTYEIVREALDEKSQVDQRRLQFIAYESMTKDFPTLRKQLEREFRAIMGMVETPISKEVK